MAYKDCDDFTYVGCKIEIECRLLSGIVVGQKVAIVPYNHPQNALNGLQCFTSKVLSASEKYDMFETEKAFYKVV